MNLTLGQCVRREGGTLTKRTNLSRSYTVVNYSWNNMFTVRDLHLCRFVRSVRVPGHIHMENGMVKSQETEGDYLLSTKGSQSLRSFGCVWDGT